MSSVRYYEFSYSTGHVMTCKVYNLCVKDKAQKLHGSQAIEKQIE
jgi:hypothetical protein